MAKAKKGKPSTSKASRKAESPKAKKQGLFSRILKRKSEAKTDAKKSDKKVASSKKDLKKSPDKKPKATSSTKKVTSTAHPTKKSVTKKKETANEKVSTKTPALKKKTSPKEVKRVEPEEVLGPAYEPTPFKARAILLEPGKLLTSEGWKRLFEMIGWKSNE